MKNTNVNVGTFLKKEREKKKISLDDVSEETKIGKKYLKAIEKGEFDIFPAETYTIGFIKNYARAIGVDPEEAVRLYKKQRYGTPPEKEEPSVEEKQPQKTKVEKKTVQRPRKEKEKKEVRKKIKEKVEPKKEPVSLSAPKVKVKLPRINLKITPVPLLVGISVVILAIIIVLIIHIIKKLKSHEEVTVNTDLNKVKVVSFNQDSILYDFTLNEWYKLRIGDKDYMIMLEKVETLPDINTTNKKSEVNEVIFHFEDSVVTIQPEKTEKMDFNLDGTFDFELKLKEIKGDLANLFIKKLHPFVVAENIQTNVKSTNEKTKKEKERKEVFTRKEKIVLEGIIREKTYIKAFIDGKELEGRIYYPNEKVHLEANDVMQLKIGNAGGIVAKINGKKVSLGKRGEIANKIIKWERDPYDETSFRLVIKDWQ